MPTLRSLAGLAARFDFPLTVALAPLFLAVGPWSWVGFGAVVLLLLARLLCPGGPAATLLDLPLLAVCVTVAVGMGASMEPASSAPKAWGILYGVAVFSSAAAWHTTEQRMHGTLLAFLAGASALALLVLLGTDWEHHPIFHVPQVWALIPRPLAGHIPGGALQQPGAGGLIHPREVAGTFALLWPFVFGLAVFAPARLTRVAWAVTGFMLLPLLLSQTPNAWAGAVVGAALVAGFRFPRVGMALLAATLFVVLASPVWAPPVLAKVAPAFNPDTQIGWSLTSRMDIYRWAIYQLHDMPLTGIGLNMFGRDIWTLYPDAHEEELIFHAHNFYLQTALDLGLPGLLFVSLALGACLVLCCTAVRRGPRLPLGGAAAGAAGAGICSFLVFGLLDTVALGAKPSPALWLLMGLGVAGWQMARPVGEVIPALRTWRRSAALLGAGLACSVAGFLLAGHATDRLALNLGTVRAHQTVYTQRTGGMVPTGAARVASAPLEQALAAGITTPHTNLLLASLYALEGRDSDAVAALRKATQQRGDIPYDLPWLTQLYRDVYDYEGSNYTLKYLSPQSRSEVPGRQQYLGIVNRTRELNPTWWEPYLQTALLHLAVGDTGTARDALDEGLRSATIIGPVRALAAEVAQ